MPFDSLPVRKALLFWVVRIWTGWFSDFSDYSISVLVLIVGDRDRPRETKTFRYCIPSISLDVYQSLVIIIVFLLLSIQVF